MKHTIIFSLLRELKIPQRISSTLSCYLLSIMLPAAKHSQVFASKISGKASSLFSNLLRNHTNLSKTALNRAARRSLRKLMRKRSALVKSSAWTVAIIIDATLQSRYSKNCQNSQYFNHGSGYKYGHQWTNIGILVAGQFIPLAPIPFLTKGFCLEKNKRYRTETDKVSDFIRTFDLKGILGGFDPSEILFLMDSGYDSKKIKKTLCSRGYDFIIALKKDRSVKIGDGEFTQVGHYFEDGRRKWKTIRIKSDGGKTRSFRIKQRRGTLKGLDKEVQLVCSRKATKQTKHFACNNLKVSPKVIIQAYQKRWRIEIFHREIKSYLGFEDTAAHSFDAVKSHVHWVYVAYILLPEVTDAPEVSVQNQQLRFEAKLEAKKMKDLLVKVNQVNSKEVVKAYCLSALERINVRIT